MLASRAKIWLQIRPGTDGALALGFLNVVIEDRLYDEAFIKKWSNAPFLVRMDEDGARLLRESDLKSGGNQDNFAIWDTISDEPGTWDSVQLEYAARSLDSRFRGNDRNLGRIIIPAKAGIQELLPGLIGKLHGH